MRPKAEALPGVLGVLTAADVPNNKVGHIQQDWDVMIAEGDITRCVGDAICLVVAETEDILNKAKKLVKIDYEELEPVRGIAEAKREDARRFIPKEIFARPDMWCEAMRQRHWLSPNTLLQILSVLRLRSMRSWNRNVR